MTKPNIMCEETNDILRNDDLIFYGTDDVARIFKCSVPTAREVMNRADFPLIMVGRVMKVSKNALDKWAMERRC